MNNPLHCSVPPISPPPAPRAPSPALRPLGTLLLLPLALTLLLPTPTPAQVQLTDHTYERAPGAPGPAATIADMSWLAGHWTAEAFGGTVDEIWSPPRGGAMMGMFRLVKDDKPVFYELMTILEEDDSLVLRLKHFDGSDLSAWEERKETVDFPLVALAENVFRFGGMSFHREDDNQVTVYLAMHGKEGAVQEVTFSYRRVPAEEGR